MSSMFRKKVLEEVGGIKAFAAYLPEDYYFASAVAAKGWKCAISSQPGWQNSGTCNLNAFHSRLESHRSSLEELSLDALLHLRINGPNDFEQFKVSKYAKAWVAANHLRSDDPIQQKKKTRDEKKLNDEVEQTDFVFLHSSAIF
uniref:ceramide glucosyltransferase n=2 Tax=Romanomermis culicivorax TaxID=13658 RepID=A0A915KER0_ROMCU